MIDMLDWWSTNQARSGGGPLRNLIDWDQSVFRVKNNTGYDLTSYDPVGLDGPLFDPTDGGEQELVDQTSQSGVEPTVADHAGGKWGVMLQAAADGEIGRCCLSGVVPVRVYVNSAADGFVDVIDAETVDDEKTYLGTGASGAKILWIDSDAEAETIVWAIVRLGQTTAAGRIYQLLSDLDDDDYEAMANPMMMNPATGVYYDPLGGEVTEGETVIVIGDTEIAAWTGDKIECEPISLDGYADPKEFEAVIGGGVSFVKVVRRVSQDLAFKGVLQDDLGSGGTVNASLTINGGVVTREVSDMDEGLIVPGQVVQAGQPIWTKYDTAERKFFVTQGRCCTP